MGHEDVQRSLSHIHHAFTTIFDDETRGTFFNDVLALDTESTYVYKNHTSYSTLPTQLQSILRHHQVQTTSARVLLQTSVSRFGASFSIHSLAPGDSMVIIGTTEKWSAARITDIFVAQSVHRKAPEVFIAVEIYAALSHKQAQHDKFLRYPLAGRLFLDRILETSILTIWTSGFKRMTQEHWPIRQILTERNGQTHHLAKIFHESRSIPSVTTLTAMCKIHQIAASTCSSSRLGWIVSARST